MITTVSARMESQLKTEAEEVLDKLGLTHSTAINALYSQIALTRSIPFNIALPVDLRKSAISLHRIQSLVRKYAEQYGAERVHLFGSYARGEASEASDIDLRVDKGSMKGFALGGFLEDLQDELGAPIDISTTESLSEEFLSNIVSEEVLLYEQ